MKYILSVLILSACATLQAQTPADQPTIRFPKPQTPPVTTEPLPETPVRLTSGVWYVIESDKPCLIYTGTQGLVGVSRKSGPGSFKILGNFWDSTSKEPEVREYKSEWVAAIYAVKSGTVDIIVSPVGATTEEEASIQTIEVIAGQGPRPPPGPTPVDPIPVDPTPVDPEPVLEGDLRFLIVLDNRQALSLEQSKALESLDVIKYMDEKTTKDTDGTTGWKKWDIGVNTDKASKVWKGIWSAAKGDTKPTPKIFAIVGTTVKPSVPLPANEADLLKFLKSYGK